jgi:glycosyltransferase involved in cell wall biosynthesis
MPTKTVLVVAYYFPPIATSGSMRPLAFCRYLERYGWRPRVLTTEPRCVYPALGVDSSLCDQIPNSVQICRVPHKNRERKLLQIRNKFRELFYKTHPFARSQSLGVTNGHLSEEPTAGFRAQYLAVKKTIFEWLFSFPDPQCFWLQPAVQRLSRIPPKEYPDVVFATGSPWTGLLVGKALAEKFGVPFVADFRDPWTNNPNRGPLSALLFRKHKELEKSVCTVAAKVIANTDELRAQFRRDNPALTRKFITITNGFDTEHCESSSALTKNREYELSNPASKPALELCHFGSVYGNRNAFPLLLAVESLFKENRTSKGQLRIRFVGDWEQPHDRCESLAKELERMEVLARHPSVPHEVCLQQMRLAQTLLILQPAYPLQVPAKIYEYIAAGRPILVIGGEGATKSLVERRRLGKCCPNEVSAIKKLLLNLIAGQLRIDPPSPDERAKFHYSNLTEKLVRVFDTIYKKQAGTLC